MGKRDPRVTEYIRKRQPFARPILEHLRVIVHEGCPDVNETIKWGHPFFEYKGPLCNMAGFKAHIAFGFWKGALVVEGTGGDPEAAMGQFGRVAAVADLPPKREILRYLKKAVALNDAGVKRPTAKRPKTPKPVVMPAYLKSALAKHAAARKGFAALAPGQQREYIEWLEEAKREETREKRLATTLEWAAEGKSRNWKYKNC